MGLKPTSGLLLSTAKGKPGVPVVHPLSTPIHLAIGPESKTSSPRLVLGSTLVFSPKMVWLRQNPFRNLIYIFYLSMTVVVSDVTEMPYEVSHIL